MLRQIGDPLCWNAVDRIIALCGLPRGLTREEAGVLMMASGLYGLTPFEALEGLSLQHGRVRVTWELGWKLAKRRGLKVTILVDTASEWKGSFEREGKEPLEVSYTAAQATEDGWVGSLWSKAVKVVLSEYACDLLGSLEVEVTPRGRAEIIRWSMNKEGIDHAQTIKNIFAALTRVCGSQDAAKAKARALMASLGVKSSAEMVGKPVFDEFYKQACEYCEAVESDIDGVIYGVYASLAQRGMDGAANKVLEDTGYADTTKNSPDVVKRVTLAALEAL